METTITITGQPNSKNELFKKLVTNSVGRRQHNYHHQLLFSSVKIAKEAILKAYFELNNEDPTDTFLYKSTDNKLLTYDAGEARIDK